jgi:NADPH2:quinone reductase
MYAMLVTAFGSPDVIQPGEIPIPDPRPMDLRIEVHAAALNPIEWKIRKGAFREGRRLPFVPTYDLAGRVDAIGSDAGNLGFKPGDAVYAMANILRDGAAAEYVCVDARTVAKKPRTLDFIHAAAMPLAFLTAWEALYDRTIIANSETILIHGGGGGVGHMAIQLARLKGARVLTTASRPETIDLCRQLGADAVIDYAKQDITAAVKELTAGRGCQVIFDTVGGTTLDQSPSSLAVGGRLVTIVGTPITSGSKDFFIKGATVHYQFVSGVHIHNQNPSRHGDILREAAGLVDAGKLMPRLDRVFPLAELADAHRLAETAHVTGKVAVRIR